MLFTASFSINFIFRLRMFWFLSLHLTYTYCFWYLYLHIYFCNRYNIILARNFSFPKKRNLKITILGFSHSTYATTVASHNIFFSMPQIYNDTVSFVDYWEYDKINASLIKTRHLRFQGITLRTWGHQIYNLWPGFILYAKFSHIYIKSFTYLF